MAINTETKIHRILVQEAERRVLGLAKSREFIGMSPLGICWPNERFVVDGVELAQICVELASDPEARRRNWIEAIRRVRPFCILQVTSTGPRTAQAIFESICGAKAWNIEGGAGGVQVRVHPSTGLGYLYNGGRRGNFSSLPVTFSSAKPKFS